MIIIESNRIELVSSNKCSFSELFVKLIKQTLKYIYSLLLSIK